VSDEGPQPESDDDEVQSARGLARQERKEQRELDKAQRKADKEAAKAEKARQKEAGEYKGIFKRMALFFRQVVAELRKVIWPTRKELISYTWVVLVFVVIMGVYVGLLDFGFGKAVFAMFGGGGGQ